MKRTRFVASIVACLTTLGVGAQARSEPDGSAHDVAPAASAEEGALPSPSGVPLLPSPLWIEVPTLASFEAGCAHGSAADCLAAARRQSGGLDVPPDARKARRFYARAAKILEDQCDHKDLDGCLRLAEDQGLDTKDRHREALYRRACEGGHVRACVELGRMVEYHTVTKAHGDAAGRARAQASALYGRACDSGLAYGCLQLRREHVDPRLLERAREQLEARCVAGDEHGCREFISRLHDLPAKEQAQHFDARWLGPACDAGFAEACARLTLQVDPRLRVPLLERACALGGVGACRSAARVYANAESGLQADQVRARRFDLGSCYIGSYEDCQRLCSLGEAPACRVVTDRDAARARERAHYTQPPRGTLGLVGLRYSRPGGLSAGLTIARGTLQGGSVGSYLDNLVGPFLAGEIGSGGASAGAGVVWTSGILKDLAIGVPLIQASMRGTVTRTFLRPVGAPSAATYAGGELGFGLALINLRVGQQWRVGGPQGVRDSLVTWGVGLGF